MPVLLKSSTRRLSSTSSALRLSKDVLKSVLPEGRVRSKENGLVVISATRRYDAFGNVVTSTGIWDGPFGYRSGAQIPPNTEHRGEGNESRVVRMIDTNGQTPSGLCGL